MTKLDSTSIGKAAQRGLIAGLAYWMIEYCLAAVLPWLFVPNPLYRPFDARFSLFLLALYLLLGLVLGVGSDLIIAKLLPGKIRERCRRLIPFAVLVVAFGFHSLYSYRYVGAPPTYDGVGLLTWALLSPLMVGLAARGLADGSGLWLTHPLILSLPFLSPAWFREYVMTAPGLGGQVRNLLLLGVAILATVVVQTSAASNRRYAGLLASLTILMLLHSLLADQGIIDRARRHRAPAIDHAPKVILITLDTVRADHMSVYGYPRETTPRLEEFAHQATLFENAQSTGSFTLPAHASLFTGLYSSWHGSHFDPPRNKVGRPLADSFTTLAELLWAYGYGTIGVASNIAFLNETFGLTQGFERHDNRARVPLLASSRVFFLRDTVTRFLAEFLRPEDSALVFRRAERINESAIKMLDEQEELRRIGQPFFLFLNYMDAHGPYLPPQPYDEMFPGKAEIKPRHFSVINGSVLRTGRALRQCERRHFISQYDGGIAYLDAQLGRLFAELKQRGLYHDSLIIITSDYGEAFGEKRLIGHGVSVYQNQVHVPLLVKFPGQTEGARVPFPVSIVDIYPTVAALTGAEPVALVQGLDLAQTEQLQERCVITESYPYGWINYWNSRLMRTQSALLCGQHKLVTSTSGEDELYDLREDPLERNNLVSAQAERFSAMRSYLSDWVEGLQNRTDDFKLDSAAAKRLRSLGYVN